MLASQRVLLEKQFQGLLLGAREIDPGIWLAKNVALHPSAQLVPPVYVGENSRIDSEVQLGPGVAVGEDCVLDTGCQLTNSVVFPGSYVGEGVKLTDKIVDKDRLVNAQFGTVVTVADHYILGSITDRLVPRSVLIWISRVRGCLLLLLALPVLLLTILFLKVFRRQPVLYKKTAVRLPASQSEADWVPYTLWSFCPFKSNREGNAHHHASLRNFLLCFLPGLVSVAQGNLNLVGVPPRSPEEIKALKLDRQFLYLQAKAGIVTEASVCYGENPSEEELYASEGHYAVTSGLWRDLRILARYFWRVFFGIFLSHRG
jgi:lipopolysaccharide/colanic/teichoic acid biosynthesis glycosyltransferase